MAKEAGRDPEAFDFTVFGLESQWRTAAEIKPLQQAGANRVVIWLLREGLDNILREMEELAAEVLT